MTDYLSIKVILLTFIIRRGLNFLNCSVWGRGWHTLELHSGGSTFLIGITFLEPSPTSWLDNEVRGTILLCGSNIHNYVPSYNILPKGADYLLRTCQINFLPLKQCQDNLLLHKQLLTRLPIISTPICLPPTSWSLNGLKN